MQFLYPTSRQFPFDEVCEQIVRELEKRGWNVPGIKVEFHDYGNGQFRTLSSIRSEEFKLWFCRVQRMIPGTQWNDTAAVSEIVIPKEELHVYEDESGPTFYLYVGDDWERDRRVFMNGGKLDTKPGVHLRYKGECHCRRGEGCAHNHPGHRTPLLVRNGPEDGSGPKVFSTDKVMDDFRKYLADVVLKAIMSHPA